MLKLIFLLISLSLACEKKDFILDTSSGSLVGSCETVKYKTKTGTLSKEVYRWLGIPYAEPPVGSRRFKSPVEFSRRQERILATKWPNSCMQLIDRRDYLPKTDQEFKPFDGFSMWRTDPRHSNMSEDCLYLNIFTPKNAYSHLQNYPIMVYFHGGSTVFGSSSMDVYNPETLVASKDIIVITINYRLGVFGFLYLQDHFPGNQALQDQSLALKWIHQNAEKFGGDPRKITIFGQSAGAMLAGYHLLYNNSWPYFKNMILQSGSPLFQPLAPITKQEANRRTIEFLNQSGCNQNDIVSCAQYSTNLPINSIDYYFKLSNFNYHNSLYLMTGFVPVLDGIILKEMPLEAFRNGRYKQCNLMIGFTKKEGTLFTAVTGLVRDFATYPHISYESFQNFIKNYFHYFPNYPVLASDERLKSILRFYANESVSSTKSYFEEMSEMLSEQMFKCPGFLLADLVTMRNPRVYVYMLDEYVESSPWPEWYGTTHSDDLAYVFGHVISERDPNNLISVNPWAVYRNYSIGAIEFTHLIMNYWTNFAKNGQPTEANDSNLEWPKYITYRETTTSVKSTDQISQFRWINLKYNHFTIEQNSIHDKCEFWNHLTRRRPRNILN